MILTCAFRGRSNGNWDSSPHYQRLEIGNDIANSITGVGKDSMILESSETKPDDKSARCILLFGSWRNGDEFQKSSQDNRVFSINGISPTIDSLGMRRPLIAVTNCNINKKKVIVYDDYNCNLIMDDIIGTITPEAGNKALRHNYKIVEVYG